MPSFLVEIYASAPDRDALAELIAETRAAVDRVTHEGSTVRLVHSICVPDDETCFFTFEGPSEEAVRHTARLAGLLSKTRNGTVKRITDLKGEQS